MKSNHNKPLPLLIALVLALLCHHLFAEPPVPQKSNASSVIVVTNAPIYHNPYVMQWDGYTNYWMELQSCTNLAEGKWQSEQVFFFPTSTIVDFTNHHKFFKVEVRHRYFTNQITTNN